METIFSRQHRVRPRGVAKIRAKTKDWLAVSITSNRKTTNRLGRNRGEGFSRYRRIVAGRPDEERGETVKKDKEGGTENTLEGRKKRVERIRGQDKTPAGANLPHIEGREHVKKATKETHLKATSLRIRHNLSEVILEVIHLAALTVKILKCAAELEVAVKSLSLFPNPA